MEVPFCLQQAKCPPRSNFETMRSNGVPISLCADDAYSTYSRSPNSCTACEIEYLRSSAMRNSHRGQNLRRLKADVGDLVCLRGLRDWPVPWGRSFPLALAPKVVEITRRTLVFGNRCLRRRAGQRLRRRAGQRVDVAESPPLALEAYERRACATQPADIQDRRAYRVSYAARCTRLGERVLTDACRCACRGHENFPLRPLAPIVEPLLSVMPGLRALYATTANVHSLL
jgi:hypothetical protein